MLQVKVFQERTSNLEAFQVAVNQFLQEHAQDIKVIDIKYTAEVDRGQAVFQGYGRLFGAR